MTSDNSQERPAELHEKTLAQPYARSLRGVRNAASNGAAFLISAVVTLLLTPLIVHGLGPTYYGIWSLISVATGLVAMLDLGMTTALWRALSRALVSGEVSEPPSLIRTALMFYLLVGSAGFLIMAVVGVALIHPLFGLTGNARETAQFAFVLAGAAFVIEVVTRAFSAVPSALQRFDIASSVRLLSTLGFAALAAVVMATHRGLRALTLAVVLSDILTLLAAVIIARRLVPELSFRPSLDTARLRALASFSIWIFAGNASAFVLYQFDRFLLGALASVSAVTYYAIAGSAASYIYALVPTIAAIAIPASTQLFAERDYARARRLYERATRLCLLLAASVAVPVIAFSYDALVLWLGEAYAAKAALLLQLLALTYLLLSLSVVPFNMLVGAGRPKISALLNVAMAVVNVVLVVILVPSFGAAGAAVAYLASVMFFPAFAWFAERDALLYSKFMWPRVIAPVLPGVGVQAAVCFALAQAVAGPFESVAIAAFTVPIPSAIYFGCRFSELSEREVARALTRRLLRRNA
jgi:O-antigen/teichoic acid export membrane protein